MMTDLVTLCDRCHADVHKLKNKQQYVSLEKVTAEFLSKPVIRAKPARKKPARQLKQPKLSPEIRKLAAALRTFSPK